MRRAAPNHAATQASQVAAPTTIAKSAYSGVKLKPGTKLSQVDLAMSTSRFVAR